jgi:hypothetical protein
MPMEEGISPVNRLLPKSLEIEIKAGNKSVKVFLIIKS